MIITLRLPLCILTACFLLFNGLLSAQDTIQTTQRPKIGLVLSGGAAKGFAHIGVIKYLDELGIQADYITGTSMGSIVGGLHAMGYNSKKMSQVAGSQDWSSLLSGYIPLKDVAPLEKQFHQKFPFFISYENGDVTLPKGVINSQKLDLLLSAMFSPAYHINDFDELNIPFRCVAVNIENGDIKVFEEGSLSRSIRASMAIPMVFTPEEINNHLYVDGGLIRNFPVEEVIDMGADIIIGVFVGAELESKDQLKSMFDIFSQSTFMMSSLDSKEQAELVDIYITPDVKDVPSFGFDQHKHIIEQGYQAAKANHSALKELADVLSEFEEPKRLKHLPIPEYLAMRRLELPETEKPFDDLALYKFGKYKRGGLSLDRLDDGITRIAGTNLYDKVSYSFNNRTDNVGVDIVAKPRNSILMSGSMNAFGNTNTSFILHAALYNKLAKPSSLKFTARISEFVGLQSLYNYRVGKNRNLVINLNAKYDKYEAPLFQFGQRQNQYNEFNAELGLYFGFEPNNSSYIELGGGINKRRLRQKNFALSDIKDYQNFSQFFRLRGQYNNLDRTQFPRQGFFAETINSFTFGQDVLVDYIDVQSQSVLHIPEVSNYLKAQLKALAVFTLFDVVTSETRINGGFKSNASLLDNFKLGGLTATTIEGISFVGVEEAQIQFEEVFSVRQDLRFNIVGPLYVSAILNYATGNRAFLPLSVNSIIPIDFLGYGAGIYYKTPLGPLSLEVGRTADNSNLNSTIGFGFRYIY